MNLKKYLKWLSTFLVLTGILLKTNMYPINIMFHGAGVVGWTIAGFLSKDKAIYKLWITDTFIYGWVLSNYISISHK